MCSTRWAYQARQVGAWRLADTDLQYLTACAAPWLQVCITQEIEHRRRCPICRVSRVQHRRTLVPATSGKCCHKLLPSRAALQKDVPKRGEPLRTVFFHQTDEADRDRAGGNGDDGIDSSVINAAQLQMKLLVKEQQVQTLKVEAEDSSCKIQQLENALKLAQKRWATVILFSLLQVVCRQKTDASAVQC